MDGIIPYQEVKLECQTVDEIVEDIGILKKIEEASKFEIGRRLVYLKETCKHGEYLPKLEEIGINRQSASQYINFFTRFENIDICQYLGLGKIRELLRIPKGKEEEYLNNISDLNEVTAKQLREEIDKLRREKEQEKTAREVFIKENQQLQSPEIKSIVNKKVRIPLTETLKKSVKVRSKSKCDKCGFDFNEYPIEEYHHINGDPSDNRMDNIALLCPNCHAIEGFKLRGGKLNE